MRTSTVLFALALTTFALAHSMQRNESSRITIKHASDAGAAKIPAKAQQTTIEDMLKQTRPDGLAPDLSSPEYQTKRIENFETTKWTVDAYITEVVKRADGDFYCVIESAGGAKTVIEAPDPELCAGSHFLDEIKSVRKMLEDKFHPTAQSVKVHIKAKLTGLGFFGFQGRATSGARTNGARLMPVLGVKLDQ